MRRLVLVLVAVLVTTLAAGSVLSSASAGIGQATGAAKTCKKTKKKKKCKKTTTAVALKDGDYTYKQAAVGSAPVNTLTISGKGTRIRIRELFFSSGEDPAGNSCAATMIDFGTFALKRTGDRLEWTTGAKPVTVPPVQTLGVGGGKGTTGGYIDVKTLEVYVTTNVIMKNRSNGSGCLEGHIYEGTQKLKRK